jgi:hypothetical protein
MRRFFFTAAIAALCLALWPSSAHAQAANIYITQSGASSAPCTTGVQTPAFFNNAANWGTGGGQIGPGTVVHLCGTFNLPAGTASFLVFQGSGTAASPITLKWETGAIVQAPYFSADHTQGAVNIGGQSYVIVDGGVNGILQNTANGTGLANSSPSTLISGMSPSGAGVTIKNLAMLNVYQQSGGTDATCSINNDWCWAILGQGSNLTIGPGNTMTWCDVCVQYGFNGGESNLRITGNTFNHSNQAIQMGPDNAGVKVMSGVTVDHNTYLATRDWDTGPILNYYHHNFFHPFTNTAGSSYVGSLQIYDNRGVGDMGLNSSTMIYLENNNGASGGSMGPWYIFNNYLNKTNSDAQTSTGIVGVMPPNGFFLNNTVVDAGGTGSFAFTSFNAYGGATGWTVQGNIFQGGEYQIAIQNPATVTANSNVYYGSVGGNTWVYHSLFTASLAAWQAACGCDSLASIANPLVQSDGSIAAGSSAISLAPNQTSLGIAALDADINGATRLTAGNWAAGAFNAPGATPAVCIAPSPVNFPAQTQNTTSSPIAVTVTNCGAGTLVLNNPSTTVSGTNGSDFVDTGSGTCGPGANIAPGGSCIVNVTFTPRSTGPETAVLAVSGNASGKVTLNGSGVAPGAPAINVTPNPQNVGSQVVGTTSAVFTETVKNTGTANLTLGASFLAFTGTEFARFGSAGCANNQTIAPGASCPISFTFTPSTTGLRSSTISVAGNAPTGSATLQGTGTLPVAASYTLTPTSFNFGNQLKGTTSALHNFTVTNTGGSPLLFSNVSYYSISGGTNPADFNRVSPGGFDCVNGSSLAPGGTCLISVAFTPSTAGAETATLSINANVSGPTSALSGTGIFPAVTITPSPVVFGSINQGSSSAAIVVTLRNSGTSPLHFSTPGLTITGDFSISSTTCTGATVAVNGTCTASLIFSPTAGGTRTGTLTVHADAPGSAALSGTGIATAPVITVTPRPVRFPGTVVGTTAATLVATVTNTGTGTETFAGSLTTVTGSEFSVLGGGTCSGGGTLGAGLSCTINVSFVPSGNGLRRGTLTVNGVGGGQSSNTVELDGVGVPAGPPGAPIPFLL